jgi:hypothetical protein
MARMMPSEVSSNDPPPRRNAPRTAARIAPRSSSEPTASPKSMAGNARRGSTNSVAVDSRPTAVSAVVVVVNGNPARVKRRIWSAPPVAAPPGSAWLTALPASCDVATSNQRSVSSATRTSSQMHTNASASSAPITANQAGNTPWSSGRLPKVAIRLGATM